MSRSMFKCRLFLEVPTANWIEASLDSLSVLCPPARMMMMYEYFFLPSIQELGEHFMYIVYVLNICPTIYNILCWLFVHGSAVGGGCVVYLGMKRVIMTSISLCSGRAWPWQHLLCSAAKSGWKKMGILVRCKSGVQEIWSNQSSLPYDYFEWSFLLHDTSSATFRGNIS